MKFLIDDYYQKIIRIDNRLIILFLPSIVNVTSIASIGCVLVEQPGHSMIDISVIWLAATKL